MAGKLDPQKITMTWVSRGRAIDLTPGLIDAADALTPDDDKTPSGGLVARVDSRFELLQETRTWLAN